MAARHNEFNINHAYLLSEYNTENIRATLGLQTGTYADFNYGAEPNELYKMIYQAYAGVKLSDKIWVDAGVFPGHTGYEAVESLYNEIYTRALSTEYTPYYETGVRITIDPSDQWTITGVILNGWQNIAETNDSKAFGVNINFRPNSKLVLNYGNYFGDEGSQFVGSRYRTFHHAYIKYQFNDAFHAVFSIDRGRQELGIQDEKGTFHFYTFITQYKINDKFSIAARFEDVADEDNLVSSANARPGFSGQVYTINFNYHVTENAMLRLESKLYKGNKLLFFGDGFPEESNELIVASLAVKI